MFVYWSRLPDEVKGLILLTLFEACINDYMDGSVADLHMSCRALPKVSHGFSIECLGPIKQAVVEVDAILGESSIAIEASEVDRYLAWRKYYPDEPVITYNSLSWAYHWHRKANDVVNYLESTLEAVENKPVRVRSLFGPFGHPYSVKGWQERHDHWEEVKARFKLTGRVALHHEQHLLSPGRNY